MNVILRNEYTALHWVYLVEILIYLALLYMSSLTRLRRFSFDSMNYVNIAQNFISGRGLAQSALGFNDPRFSIDDQLPAPVTSHPPVYPLLIALFSRFRMSCADAALSISVICYGILLYLSFLLVRDLYDDSVALISVTCLLLFQPLRKFAMYACSEMPSVLFAFLSFWLLINIDKTQSELLWIAFISGVSIGLAFATRYAFLPFFFLQMLALINFPPAWMFYSLTLYTIGFTLPTLPLIRRNLVFSKTLLGKKRNPSLVSVGHNIQDALRALLGFYLHALKPEIQVALFELSIITVVGILTMQGKLPTALEDIFIVRKGYLLFLWASGYLVILVYQRTRIHFDRINLRLVLPAWIMLVFLWVALVSKMIAFEHTLLLYLVLILLVLAIHRELHAIINTPRYDVAKEIASSERLSWIATHTTDNDLIIGDDTMDIPFYFRRRATISFSPYPYTDHLDYGKLREYIHTHSEKYTHFYVLLRNRYKREQTWQQAYGTFIADIVCGRIQRYPNVLYLCRLNDGYVFEILCQREHAQ